MREQCFLLAVFMHIAAFGGAAAAQTNSPQTDINLDKQHCGSPDYNVSIKYCTSAIQSGLEKGVKLGLIFFNRGSSYDAIGQYARAIQDY